MKFIALISGGKDSIYAALEGVKFGHQLTGLGHLYPVVEESKDTDVINNEIDSYMFQTVGSEAIPLIAEGMDKPLIRKPLRGKSVNQQLFYDLSPSDSPDEVEDLFQLLLEAKHSFGVEAVSCGAILSDYQRLRVEHVCDRLQLISLAYLWQRDQAELLDAMISEGIDARLVKVAGIGLKKSFLLKSIAELRDELHRLQSLFQINVCGEGGEFETLVVDCPLFKKYKISIDKYSIITVTENDLAPVAHVYASKLSLVEKEDTEEIELYESFSNFDNSGSEIEVDKSLEIKITNDLLHIPKFTYIYVGEHIFQTQLMGLQAFDDSVCPDSIKEEAEKLLNYFESLLANHDLSFKHVTKVVMYIKQMSAFIAINEVYKKYFKFKPATRICVGQSCDPKYNIMIELFGVKSLSKIKHLHVQSVSYWAPANIGPYSQACESYDWVQYAGQIGLRPESMTLISKCTMKQLNKTIENYDEVMSKMNVSSEFAIQGIVYFNGNGK